jgi:hypothetical protein
MTQTKDHELKPISPRRRYAAAFGLFCLGAALAPPGLASEPQAGFVFDTLGPAACEMPPASFDLSQFRAYAEATPDAPIARGEIAGSPAIPFAGGGLYGADDGGGFVVGVQGMLFDDGPQLTMLCLVLVRLGDSDETAGTVVGEDGLDAAPDGSFLGVFKLVRRSADGASTTHADGRIERGSAQFTIAGGLLIDGSVSIEGVATPLDGTPASALTFSIQVPVAENVLRPALRLTRN